MFRAQPGGKSDRIIAEFVANNRIEPSHRIHPSFNRLINRSSSSQPSLSTNILISDRLFKERYIRLELIEKVSRQFTPDKLVY